MSLLSGFGVSLSEVRLLGQAAMAAFEGGAIPAGWNVVTPQQLGIAAQYHDGNYFTNGGASAIVLQQGNSWIVSFRGTDDPSDPYYFPQLANGSYINNFQPLLSAVAAAAPAGSEFAFTGASLGGGATNQMADIAATAYGGEFAAASFVAFASPFISNAGGILNFGFENDPIYRSINSYGDNPSSLDNLVLATAEYMAGNYDGLHPYDEYAHSRSELAFDAIDRLAVSNFHHLMNPDSVVIFDANAGAVQDITPGRESVGAFYLGEQRDDHIAGRAGNDFLEGFAGNDLLLGGEGDDALHGGSGDDWLLGGNGVDTAFYGAASAHYGLLRAGERIAVVTSAADGKDQAEGVEVFQFTDRAVAAYQIDSALEYIASHDDLIAAFGTDAAAGLNHFFHSGFFEGRQVTFEALEYTASYSDLIAAFGTNEDASARHFIATGEAEGRQITFEPSQYLANYADVRAAFGLDEAAATRHFIATGYGERRLADDPLEYVASYGDLIGAFQAGSPADIRWAGLNHYQSSGFDEGRPTDLFDVEQYLANYEDLRMAFADGTGGYNEDAATLHFIQSGYDEGRTDDVLIV